ncbi:MAG: hypothetical protein JWO82_67, partial [Akkermansiaceae bacterium]|nr:hypothetical protein [Akkermansiaceae bacterium]
MQYDIPGIEDFAKRVTDIQRRGFQDSAFSHFFKAPDALYISELAIPPSPADAGPSFFGAADKVKPSGWLAHYSGFIQAPRDIHFRFVGSADDYISVFSKGRPRLIACHSEAQAAIQEKWEPSRTDKDYTGPMGTLVHGDWIRLKKGEIMPID